MTETTDCRTNVGEAVGFIDAAHSCIRQAERFGAHNYAEFGEACKDFMADPLVFRFIARCFARGQYPKDDMNKVGALAELLAISPPRRDEGGHRE